MRLFRFDHFLTPPVFEDDEEKTRVARHLHFLLLVVLAAAPLGIVLFYFISPTSLPRVFTVVIPIPLIFLIAAGLARRGWVYQGAFFIVLVAWVSSTINNFLSGGLKSPGFGVGSLLIIILAGLLLGQRGAFITILLNVVMVALFAWAASQPWMPAVPVEVSTTSILTSYLLNMVVAGALMYLTIVSIKNSLDRARSELAERRQVDKELRESEQNYRVLYETAQKQARELALEGNIRTAMAQNLDLTVLLRRVVESIAESYGYTLVSLYLIEGDSLILQHQVGYEKVIHKIALTKGISGRVVRTGQSFMLEDVHSDPEFLGAIEGIISEICIPLFDEGRVVGTLNVESTNNIKLTGADLELLTGLSEHIGLAIWQARLYSKVSHRNQILSALGESTLVIMQYLDLDTVLGTIVSQAAQILDTVHGYIYLIQPDEKTMQVSTGIGAFSESIGIKLVPGEGLAGKVWNSGQPVCVANYHDWPGRSNKFEEVEFRAVVGVPLVSRSKVVGVLGLAYIEPGREFSEENIELLNQFAKLASIALENARLYTKLQSELNKQIALRNAGAAISSSLKLSEVLSEICKQMAVTIDATSAYIVIYSSDHSAYTVVADYVGSQANDLEKVSDLNVTYYRRDGVRFFDRGDQKNYVVLQTDDENLTPWFRNNLTSFGGKSILQVPLYVQGNLLGHAELWESRQRREFTKDEIAFCQAVSQQAAIAIANADTFEKLQRELFERRRIETVMEKLIASLEDKNAELERFTYTVSHDLKSPLVTINGFLGYLEKDMAAGDMERYKQDSQRIQEAVNKMYMLLSDLLELSRIGRMMNAPETIPFAELMRDAKEAVHGRLEARGVTVTLQPNLPSVYGDRQRLTEVLQNLIDNAAKYMGSQPEPGIEIGQRGEDDGKPVFFVKDNGMGIAPEYHERVFGLFNKLDAKSEGTGVGLALVKRIIEIHGCRIWVESESGQGSTFYFTLPKA
ncbi:MAG: GAF domain-containing protein [Anaerolineales bacterium]|nr:GAF domain-containing protein [Anaerolineales bacterium]